MTVRIIELPVPAWQDGLFVPEADEIRRSEPGPTNLHMRVADPVVIPVAEEVLAALAEEPGRGPPTHQDPFGFSLVALRATFLPETRDRLDSAWVALDLTAGASAPDGPGPIAWSMSPLRQYRTRRVTSRAKLGAGLKLITGEAEAEESYEVEEPFLLALDELTSKPSWAFRRTPQVSIAGVYELNVLVKFHVSAGCRGQVRWGAAVRKRGRLFSHLVEVAGHTASPISCGGSQTR